MNSMIKVVAAGALLGFGALAGRSWSGADFQAGLDQLVGQVDNFASQAKTKTNSDRSGNAARGEMDFSEAKKVLRKIDRQHPVDYYCACRFDPRSQQVDVGSCGVDSPVHADRTRRIEYEHVVPASSFGRQRPCWRNAPAGVSGREHCRETDPVFRAMEGDMFNLVPAVGSLNAVRSDLNYGEIAGEARQFGQCDFEIDRATRRIEPPEEVKGDIARINFYFERRYGMRLSPQQRRLFEAWSRMDPPSEWEIERTRQIAAAASRF